MNHLLFLISLAFIFNNFFLFCINVLQNICSGGGGGSGSGSQSSSKSSQSGSDDDDEE